MKKLLLASVLAIASFPVAAHADSCADYNACFLEEGNKLDENGAPQCGNKPPKCEINLDLAAARRDCIEQSGSKDGTRHEPEEAAAFDRCMRERNAPKSPARVTVRFRPWQQVWQCNDIRVTVTERAPGDMEYDIGGTIWGGSRFFKPALGPLHMNGRPCAFIGKAGY
jgi:hypothetical protein